MPKKKTKKDKTKTSSQLLNEENLKILGYLGSTEESLDYFKDKLYRAISSKEKHQAKEISKELLAAHWKNLLDNAAKIFSDYHTAEINNNMDSRLLARTKEYAALLFPCSAPQFNIQKYFISCGEEFANYIEGGTNGDASYFFFLKYLLDVQAISVSDRLAYLAGMLRFFNNNYQNLSFVFLIKVLEIFNEDHVKRLWEENKEKKLDPPEEYQPNFSSLFTSSEDDGLKKRLIIINLDKKNLQGIDLIAGAFFLKEELNRFTQLIMQEAFLEQFKNDEFLEIYKVFQRFIKNYPDFFESNISDFLYNKWKAIELKREVISSELARKEAEAKQAEEARIRKAEEEEKAKVAERISKEEKVKVKRETEEEIKKLSSNLNNLFAELAKGIKNLSDFTAEILKTSKVKELEQKIKSEEGKIAAKLSNVCDLLNLKTTDFSGISPYLEAIKNTVIEKNKEFSKEYNFLIALVDIEKAEETIKNLATKSNVNEKLTRFGNKVTNLNAEIASIYNVLAASQDLATQDIAKFNKCKEKIEELVRQFYPLSVAYKAYAYILTGYKEVNKYEEFNEIETKLSSLNKLFCELSKGIEANAKPKQAVARKEGQTERSDSLLQVALTEYQEYVDWDNDFKERFFNTLEIIHRLPYITFAQGGKELVAIFLRKLAAYEKEISQEEKNLSDWKASLSAKNRKRFRFVLQEAKSEFTYHGKLIADLKLLLKTYGLETTEFTHRDPHWKANFNQQFRDFEAFFPELTKLENDCIALRRSLVGAGTENAEVKREYLEKRGSLEKMRETLGEYNEMFRRLFANQPPQAFASQPLQVPIVTVPVLVPAAPVLISQTFFRLPVTVTQTSTFSPQTSSEVSTQETIQKTLPKKS